MEALGKNGTCACFPNSNQNKNDKKQKKIKGGRKKRKWTIKIELKQKSTQQKLYIFI